MKPARDLTDYEIRYHILNLPITSPNWPARMAALLAEKKRRAL